MQASASAGTPVGAGARSQPGSRPASPVKRATSTGPLHVTAQLAREASAGVIRKGGVESRMNVITNDYVPPPKEEKRIDVKRSRSQPSVGVSALFCL
jgi:cell division cycle protein 20 (cofactor of APC complex)